MNKAPRFHVMSEHVDMPCHERHDDVVSLIAPDVLYAKDGAVIMPVLNRLLRHVLAQCQEQVDEHLHHAEFYLTGDMKVITDVVADHCAACIHGKDQADAFLRDNPGKELLVGRIWWLP